MDFPVEQYLDHGVNPSEPIVRPEAVGVLSLDSDEHLVASLTKCINVRSITVETDIAVLPSWFQRFEKLRELSVTSYDLKSLPAWLSDLKDLRHLSLDRCSSLKGIPEHVWRIPRLESLWLFHTTFESLAGIEHAPALRELVIHSDELEPQIPTIAERLRKARGVTRVTLDGTTSPTLRIERKPTARLPGSAKKNAQILSHLPRGFDCRGIDLRGQTAGNASCRPCSRCLIGPRASCSKTSTAPPGSTLVSLRTRCVNSRSTRRSRWRRRLA